MALVKCTECGKEVSDKAAACPGCGAPIAPVATPQVARVARQGGKWEAAGFVLIVIGIVLGIAIDPRLGWLAGVVGLVVFIVGRFK